MTQDERWQSKWQIAIDFIRTNKRNPSKFDGAEREIRNWIRHSKKMMNAEMLKADRVEMFKKLLELSEQYKHKNQYQ